MLVRPPPWFRTSSDRCVTIPASLACGLSKTSQHAPDIVVVSLLRTLTNCPPLLPSRSEDWQDDRVLSSVLDHH